VRKHNGGETLKRIDAVSSYPLSTPAIPVRGIDR